MNGVKYVRRKIDPRAIARPDLGPTGGAITVKPPIENPQKIKKSLMQKIIPLIFVAVIIGMLAVMIFTGRRKWSPYMLMMPLSMLGGVLGFNIHGGGGNEGDSISELDENRKEYYNYLSVVRKEVHKLARQQFLLQQYYFPDPAILTSVIDREEFWSRHPNPPGGIGIQADRTLYDPYLSIRLGVGKTRIHPALETQNTSPSEYLEPVTAIAYRRFMRTQSLISNMPIAVNLGANPYLRFIGKNNDTIRALGRSLLMGLCVSHSPEHVLVVIITHKPREYWEFIKWLPHAQHPEMNDFSGAYRMIYPSVEQASEGISRLIEDRSVWTKPNPAEPVKPFIVVILDRELPLDAKLGPITSAVRNAMVIIDLAAVEEDLASMETDRIYIIDGDRIRAIKNNNLARADAISLAAADVISRKLAPYRVPSQGDSKSDGARSVELGFLHALGIDDPGTFDPRIIWEKTAQGPKSELLKFPLGIKYHNTQTPTGEYVYLDIKEAALAGIGPHGVLQGMTGTGKSYLMRGWILGALTLHSPEEINFICVDFKGYTTFQGLSGVPHIISIITNMEEESDLMDRFADVIDGEIIRRQRAFRETSTVDYVSYNKMREVDNSIPPMPALILFLDETQQFLKAHPEYKQKFETWGAIGRSLRIHIVICQQTYDAGVVGGFDNHRTYGISLAASSERASNSVVGTPDAAHLPRPGWAIVYGDERRALFRSFNISQIYVPSSERSQERIQRSQKTSTLRPFFVVNEASQAALGAAEKTEVVKAKVRTEQEEMLLPKIDAVLADRLSQFGKKARQMWLPPLNMPLTFADLPIPQIPSLQIPIGLSDAPKLHDRPPFYINFAGATANIRVIGTANSGKSMAIQTIVTALSLVQPPSEVNFYIIDNGGGKLSYLESLPHVGGYARPNDLASAHRIAGEFIRMMDVRKELFFRTGATTVSGYLDAKRSDPSLMKEDPYGRMFLVIDGWKTFRSMSQQDSGMTGTAISDQVLQSLREGANYGIHIIVTVRQEMDIPMNSMESFRTTVLLKADDAIGLSMDAKQIFRSIPAKYPGRGVDSERALHMRVAVPQMEPLAEPDANVKISDVYNDQYDYSSGSAALVERILGKYDPNSKAPRVSVLAGELRREDVLTPEIRRIYANQIIIGVAESDAQPRVLPPNAPNFFLYGDPSSGKTTVLRNYIQTIIEQKGPDRARFIIVDFQRSLLRERQVLHERGYLNAYVNDFTKTDALGKSVDKFMTANRTMSADITTQQIIDKSWWDPKFPYEIYFLVDDYHLVTTSQGNPLLPLAPWVSTSRDTGIHFIISRNAGSLMRTMSDRFITALNDINTPGLLLSGPKSEKILGSKMTNRRAGQGELIDPASGRKDIIQTLWIESLS